MELKEPKGVDFVASCDLHGGDIRSNTLGRYKNFTIV